MKLRLRLLLAGILLAGLCTAWMVVSLAEDPDSNWPQWRGPGGQGIFEDHKLPLEWGTDRNLHWKAAIPGKGHSSPVIWGDKIFLTAAVQGSKLEKPTAIKHFVNGEEFQHPHWSGSDHTWTLQLLCLDRLSGRILWEQTAYQGKVYDHIHQRGSYASTTPVTDGQSVWIYFGPEGLFRYDLEGNQKWKKSLGGVGTIGMGTGTSPVLYKDKLIVVADQEMDGKDSYMAAFDKQSGNELWRVKRTMRVSWATPLLVETDNGHQLVVSGAEKIVSYHPETGKELWRTEGVVSHAIPSPVSDGKYVYVSAGSQAKRSMALRLGSDEQLGGKERIVWRYDKGAAYVPSPIYYQGHFYLISDRGVITCLEAGSGEVVYENRMPETGSIKSSLLAGDGKIYVSNEEGKTFVIKAGPEFEVLAINSIGEPIRASLAVSRGTIYLRGAEHLYAIGQ